MDSGYYNKNNQITMFVVIILLINILYIFYKFYLVEKNNQLEQAWLELNEQGLKYSHNLNQLKQNLGYGGFIHHFKNFVLRRDKKYIKPISLSIYWADKNIKDLKKLKLSKDEINAINIIELTYEEYKDKFLIAKEMVDNGASADEIDQFVKVDDSDAFEALNFLERSRISKNNTRIKNNNESLDEIIKLNFYGLLIIPILIILAIYLIYKAKEVVQLNNNLLIANEMKNNFLGNVSHELRTPLNIILSVSQMLRMGFFGKLDEAKNKQLDLLINHSNRLLEVIDGILDMIDIKTNLGSYKANKTIFDLSKLLDDLINLYQGHPFCEEVEVLTSIENDIQICGDKKQIRQIFQNLFQNAGKYTKKGYINVFLFQHENIIVLGIEDTGIGIAQKEIKKIYDDFYQVNPSIDSGLGLGLSIVKKLVTANDGRIYVQSEPGKGSEFTVVLFSGESHE